MENMTVIENALRFYIQHLERDIVHLRNHGNDTGFLAQHLEEAKDALNKLNA